MALLELFAKVPYIFLVIENSPNGNIVTDQYSSNGVFQRRDGYSDTDNTEVSTADANLWISPDEPFIAALSKDLVGHAIRVDGVDYRITNMIIGVHQDTGIVDNYTLDLKKERLASWLELPLE